MYNVYIYIFIYGVHLHMWPHVYTYIYICARVSVGSFFSSLCQGAPSSFSMVRIQKLEVWKGSVFIGDFANREWLQPTINPMKVDSEW